MAVATLTHHRGGAQFKLGQMLKNIATRVHQRIVYTQTLKALTQLDSRSIKDLGLSRSEFKHLALVAAYGEDAVK